VTVDVTAAITEYIREANHTGGCCTSRDVQRCVLQQHQLRTHDPTLHSTLTSMDHCYGRARSIGRMNDEWYTVRIRTFLTQYCKTVVDKRLQVAA
jgi:hypothetical protein